jgi:hypothetical protein
MVELMIAQRHHIGLHQFQQLELRATVGQGGDGRTLHIVARHAAESHSPLSRVSVHIRLQHGGATNLHLLLFPVLITERLAHRHILRMKVIVMQNGNVHRLLCDRRQSAQYADENRKDYSGQYESHTRTIPFEIRFHRCGTPGLPRATGRGRQSILGKHTNSKIYTTGQ